MADVVPTKEAGAVAEPVALEKPKTPRALVHGVFVQAVIGLLRVYQMALSPWIGPSCRFVPSCSQYAMDAITHHGVFRGSVLAVRRLSRCHPFHEGGYDPAP